VAAERAWRERGLALRNRLLASPRFVRWATGFPLTRPLAQRRARRLFDLCAGFVYSQVLLACVRLQLFDRVREEPRSAADLARELSLAPEALRRLLGAAASLDLLERRRGDRFGLGALGAVLAGTPGLEALIEHHRLLYADLSDPVALLRGDREGTELGRYWPYADARDPEKLEAEQVASYTRLMAASQALVADPVLDAYPLRGHRCLLDVGGGDGAFLAAAGRRAPDLRLMLFELPAVAERARARLAEGGLEARASVFGGDFFCDPLPVGADVVSLVRVIHDHDDERALAILRAVRRALPDDGVLLLAEPMSGTRGAEPIGDAYFAFYLLAMGSGRARSPAELESLLRSAGFGGVRRLRTRMPLQTRLLVARPASSPRASSSPRAWRNHGV